MTKMSVCEITVFLGISALIILAIYALGLGNLDLPLFGLYRSSVPGVCGQFAKRQWVRLLDIFVLGPMGVYIGYKIWIGKTEDLHIYLGLLTILYGVLTVAYNGSNYLKN